MGPAIEILVERPGLHLLAGDGAVKICWKEVDMAQSVLASIDEAIAIRYATVRLELKKIGRPIPENDKKM